MYGVLASLVFIILIERQIQSSGRNSIFGIFVNPIMRKAAPLIISSESNLAEEPQLQTPRSVLSKTKRAKLWQNESAQCTRKRSYQNNAYEVTTRGIVLHPDRVLVKTSTDNSRWQTERCSDDRSSWSLYTSKVIQYYKKHPLGQRASRVASGFLGKYASISPMTSGRNWLPGIFMNLIQRKSDLKLFNSLSFYSNKYGILFWFHY